MSAEVVTQSLAVPPTVEATRIRPEPQHEVQSVVLPGRRFVMELLGNWMRELGYQPAMASNADVTNLALRAAASRGVILVDAGCGERLHDRHALVSRCREQGAEILAVMAEDDPLSVAGWIEAGATGVLSQEASMAEVADVLQRLVRHEVVMGVAVREGLLARLRERRSEDADRAAAFAQLTRREAQVLRELATGASPDEVARLSYVSLNTVRSQIRSVLAKLGVNSVVAAVALAYRSGWLASDGRMNRQL